MLFGRVSGLVARAELTRARGSCVGTAHGTMECTARRVPVQYPNAHRELPEAVRTGEGMVEISLMVRDIRILGVAGMHRSTVPALRRKRFQRAERTPMRRELLARLHGDVVLLTTRNGDSLIGRLRVTCDEVELWQALVHVPCRYRVVFDDIVACCLYGSDEPTWDAPTAPL